MRNALQILESPAQPWEMLYKFWKVPRSREKCFTNFGKSRAAVGNALQILESPAQPWEMLYKFWKVLRSREKCFINFGKSRAVVGNALQILERPAQPLRCVRKFSYFHSLPFAICPNIRTFAQTNFK